MVIYDARRQHIAKLRRNAWAFNNNDRFDITTHPSSLKLIDKETNRVVVEVNVTGTAQIQVLNGHFFTHKGDLLEITPEFWKVHGITMSNNVIDSSGGAVALG